MQVPPPPQMSSPNSSHSSMSATQVHGSGVGWGRLGQGYILFANWPIVFSCHFDGCF